MAKRQRLTLKDPMLQVGDLEPLSPPTMPLPEPQSSFRDNHERREAKRNTVAEEHRAQEAWALEQEVKRAQAQQRRTVREEAAKQKSIPQPPPIHTVHDLILAQMAISLSPVGSPRFDIVGPYRDQIMRDLGQPADPIERMLVDQVMTAHSAIMSLHSIAHTTLDGDDRRVVHAILIPLMGEMRQMSLALKEYRSDSKPTEQLTPASPDQSVKQAQPPPS